MTHYIINFKWQKQHSDSGGSQHSFTQTVDNLSGDAAFREAAAILQGGGSSSHFSSKYYTNIDERMVELELGLSFPKLHSFIATYKTVVNNTGCTLKKWELRKPQNLDETRTPFAAQKQGTLHKSSLQAAYVSVTLKPKCTVTKFLKKIKHRVLSNLKF